jgi:hypothetical protein
VWLRVWNVEGEERCADGSGQDAKRWEGENDWSDPGERYYDRARSELGAQRRGNGSRHRRGSVVEAHWRLRRVNDEKAGWAERREVVEPGGGMK